ncbi:MAG: DUF4160 domain-containing protein [Desulfonatronovibrio sp.]
MLNYSNGWCLTLIGTEAYQGNKAAISIEDGLILAGKFPPKQLNKLLKISQLLRRYKKFKLLRILNTLQP